MLLYYVRHGDPIYDPDSLTPLGLRQAEAVSKRLAVHGIDRIFASSSNRAILTATPTSEICKKEIQILDWTNEKYAWEQLTVQWPNGGKTWAISHPETRKQMISPEVVAMGKNWYDHPYFARTTYKEGVERIRTHADAFLAELGYEHHPEGNYYIQTKPNQERVALFAHEGFGGCFLSCILDIPYPMYGLHFSMSHSDVTVVQFEERDGIVIPCVLTASNDSHLYREGLPLKYQNSFYI